MWLREWVGWLSRAGSHGATGPAGLARPLPSLAVVGGCCVGGYDGSRVRVCTVTGADRDLLPFAVVVAAAVRCGDGGMTGVLGDDVVGMAFCMRRFTDSRAYYS